MALWGPYSRLSTDEENNKPLPSLPSPTLTNPDLVLPDEPFSRNFDLASQRNGRGPVISYLRQKNDDLQRAQNRQSLDIEERQLTGYHGPTERRGLLSRKMLLVRSNTGGGNIPDDGRINTPTKAEGSGLASSPLLNDHLTVAPQGPPRRASSSSLDSEEMAKMPEFLKKYKGTDPVTDDDITDAEGGAGAGADGNESAADAETRAYNAERKVKQEEEQVSMMLSQRAEEILANAKKRLNLMEGNLRGARDLVAPLTAANLKRATSLSHSFGSPSVSYAHRRLDSLAYDSDPYNPSRRMLQSQASSPAMRSDFFGHTRGASDLELADRPYTAFSSRSPYLNRSPRFPVKPSEPVAANLRAMRSHDALGISKLNIPDSSNNPGVGVGVGVQRSKDSPNSALEPVSEDEDRQFLPSKQSSSFGQPANQSIGLGVSTSARSISSCSATTSDDLRDQMESLKGRISSLKVRAQEDRLRRASNNNLRNPSPFNNAAHTAPEFWYTQPSNYGISAIDTQIDATGPEQAREDSPTTPHAGRQSWRSSGLLSSRNAFAEKAARDQGLAAQSSASEGSSPVDKHTSRFSVKRASGGTAIMTSPRKRSPDEQHQQQQSRARDMPGSFERGQFDSSDEYESDLKSEDTSLMPNSEPSTPEPNGILSSDEEEYSLEEEEESDALELDEIAGLEDRDPEAPEFIAHEDREDAFDYEHFFLHSAMGSYTSGRDSPDDSDLSSVSSAETARAPYLGHEDLAEYDDDLEDEDDLGDELMHDGEVYDMTDTLRTPGTPDALKRIEARLSQVHGRSVSTESLDTINTFATATEGRETPAMMSRSTSRIDRPVTPTDTARPGTAVRTASTTDFAKPPALTALEADDASDRADSGVGGLAQSQGQVTPRSTPGPGSDGMPRSTPSSPAQTVVQHRRQRTTSSHEPQDPTTLAFKTLLEPDGKPLGLKDKAVIFGLIESLRSICVRLQREDEAHEQVAADQSIDQVVRAATDSDGLVLRKRLEDARRVLDGLILESAATAD